MKHRYIWTTNVFSRSKLLSFCLGDHKDILKVDVCKKCNFFEVGDDKKLHEFLNIDIPGKKNAIDGLFKKHNQLPLNVAGCFHCWGVEMRDPGDFSWDGIAFNYFGWV